ncbi:MAG TPA: Hpt domain-containing protein [Candidatus Hungatella pullicola]|nr:Hpt domain-containing protein [Candidatus Hungatella pullicola]
MTLKQCYEEIHGDYEGTVARFRGERLAMKFIIRFLEDRTFDGLCSAVENQDYEEAFRMAHTLKGVCANLGLSALLSSSSRLTEALRSGEISQVLPLFQQVERDYTASVTAVTKLKEEQES